MRVARVSASLRHAAAESRTRNTHAFFAHFVPARSLRSSPVPRLTTPTRSPPRHAGLLYYSILAVVFAYVVGFTCCGAGIVVYATALWWHLNRL